MSNLTTNPTRPAIAGQRAQVMTEAVVSAYIREITRPRRVRERANARRTCSPSPRAIARTPLRGAARLRALAMARAGDHRVAARAARGDGSSLAHLAGGLESTRP